MLRKIALILLLFRSASSHCQNFDSLIGKAFALPDDTVKFNKLLEIASKYENLGDYEHAVVLNSKAQEIAGSLKNDRLYIDAGCRIARNHLNQNDYAAAKTILDTLLILSRKSGYIIGEGTCYRFLAQTKLFEGDYQKATEFYLEAQGKWNESANLKKIATGYSDLGTVNYYRHQYKAAIGFYYKSYQIDSTQNWPEDLASDLNNLGYALIEMKEFKSADSKFKEAISLNKSLGRKAALCNNYNNLIKLECQLNNLPKAILYSDTVLKISLETNDQSEIGTAYSNLCELHRLNGHPDKSIEYGHKALGIAKKINDNLLLSYVYQTLAYSFKDKKQPDSAFHYITEYTAIKDTLLNLENTKQIVELEKKFELGQKEKENQLLNQQLRVQEVESSRQQITIVSVFIIVCILAVIAVILVRQNRQKNRINSQLAEKNHIIEEKQKEILDSITYAKRLQEAILPPLSLIRDNLPESFLYYQPKDIIAGDFYWMEKTGSDTLLIAAADCTGHGVPGAMVSVVCSNALNRAVLEFNLTEPGRILDKARELVLDTFAKSDQEVKDGMDISLASIQRQPGSGNVLLKWSGANNPLWYTQAGEIKEITANKQPIGKTENPVPFVTHTIELRKGESFFLFTDGYADQFGGPKGKKFKYKKLKELLLKNAGLTPAEQKHETETAFVNWKGSLEQVDDVCIIGVRV